MRNHGDSGAVASGPRPGRIRGDAELGRRLCDASERRSRLESERFALEEVRESLAAEEGSLVGRVSAIEKECAELATKRDASLRRIAEIDAEVLATDREIAALEDECSVLERRIRRLTTRAEALERESAAYRKEVSTANRTLRAVHDSMARIDDRLALAESATLDGQSVIAADGGER